MKLIAISGGVDSMVLASLYKHDNIILAFVNYNIRNDTWKDEEIVTNFATQNQIILEKLTLNVNEKEKNENFQNWARQKRYSFFKQIYDKYKCTELLVAHHKDDFLETCLMQYNKNKNKLFYGIKEKIEFMNMEIYRPLLFKFWKNEIYEYAKLNKIEFNDDISNFESKYERNKFRNEFLKNCSTQEKEKMINNFILWNKNNNEKQEEINNEYQIWKKKNFCKKIFIKLSNKREIITNFLNEHIKQCNLNKNIIDNIISFFLASDNSKKFKLNNNYFLSKRNNELKAIKTF